MKVREFFNEFERITNEAFSKSYEYFMDLTMGQAFFVIFLGSLILFSFLGFFFRDKEEQSY